MCRLLSEMEGHKAYILGAQFALASIKGNLEDVPKKAEQLQEYLDRCSIRIENRQEKHA